MKILVTGKHGQVAQALGNAGRHHELVFASRPELDLQQPDHIRDFILRLNPDLILSCAAFTHVDACESNPEQAYIVNGTAPGRLAAAADELGIPIVHLSTDYVFDGALRRAYKEDDVPNPLSIYGRSKLAGEVAVMGAAQRGFVIRVSWVYSQFSNNFLSNMLKMAETRAEISVVDDQISCPTPGVELAAALLDFAERVTVTQASGDVYHLAGRESVDRATLAEAVMHWAAARSRPAARILRVPTSAFPTPARRPLQSVLDCRKIERAHGLVLPSWREWLDASLAAIANIPK